jgi:hypothetical protein
MSNIGSETMSKLEELKTEVANLKEALATAEWGVDCWKYKAQQAEQERDAWKARAEKAEEERETVMYLLSLWGKLQREKRKLGRPSGEQK